MIQVVKLPPTKARITADILAKLGCCEPQTERFRTLFPKGLPVTVQSLNKVLSVQTFQGRAGGVHVTDGAWQLAFFSWRLSQKADCEELGQVYLDSWVNSKEYKKIVTDWFKANQPEILRYVQEATEHE
jgi:hypothetical protein